MAAISFSKIPLISAVLVFLGMTISTGRANASAVQFGKTTESKRATTWQPAPGTHWQIVLEDALSDTSLNVPIYDIDLFTNPMETINTLHGLNRKVIWYFSAGTYEDFRPDSKIFLPSDIGEPLANWPGEWWLDTSSPNVRKIMLDRLDLAKSKGCDGVDPDNVDGYQPEIDTGFALTTKTAIEYMSFLADAASDRSMSIGLKNAGEIVADVLPFVQYQVNEQCVEQQNCADFQPFLDANKPVFNIEYPPSAPKVHAKIIAKYCGDPSRAGFSTDLKEGLLTNWVYVCP